MNIITTWEQIPEFDSREQEAEFWSKNGLGAQLMANSRHESDGKESTTITLRFDPRMLSRIKRMARSRYLNYQSMMKQWLSERLEEEMRKSSSSNDKYQ